MKTQNSKTQNSKTQNSKNFLTAEKIDELTVVLNEKMNNDKIEKEVKIYNLRKRINDIKLNFNKNNNKINIFTTLINNLDDIDEDNNDKDDIKDELENKIQFILDTNATLKNKVKELKIELLDLEDEDLNEML